MAMSRATSMALAIALLLVTFIDPSYAQLKVGFYTGKCGKTNVEQVVFDTLKSVFAKDKTVTAALLRLQFHDCFVNGCDAALLLDGINTEKTAGPNLSVRGYEVIDKCKSALEIKCPGVVSCADIIAMATKASVFLAGGIFYNVETGRRDTVVSKASDAVNQLPGARISVNAAVQAFSNRGIKAEDFVLLLGGGHSVGVFHCNFFQDRLYNFNNTNRADPSMNVTTVAALRNVCPRTGSSNVVACDQTPGSSQIVDNGYYKAIVARKGVIQIDQQIALSPLTKGFVSKFATTNDFATKFGAAMVSLGRAKGTLTGTQGEIRKSCRAINVIPTR